VPSAVPNLTIIMLAERVAAWLRDYTSCSRCGAP
jgi:hypothetical protein